MIPALTVQSGESYRSSPCYPEPMVYLSDDDPRTCITIRETSMTILVDTDDAYVRILSRDLDCGLLFNVIMYVRAENVCRNRTNTDRCDQVHRRVLTSGYTHCMYRCTGNSVYVRMAHAQTGYVCEINSFKTMWQGAELADNGN